jgi:3-oxoacyl-(acyl-carrier-protein) synthase
MDNFACGIAITGCSAISAAGIGIEALQKAVEAGVSYLKPIPSELMIGKDEQLWGKADAFKATDFIAPLKARKMDRASQLSVAVAGLALADAGFVKGSFAPERIGIALGCGFGGIANSSELLTGFYQGGVSGLSPMLFPNTVANASAGNTSIEYGLKGPNITFIQRFCSAESAILAGCRFIEEGRVDLMLAGGVDELTPQMLRGFQATGQLTLFASGFGEGCGLLVLERVSHARERGAAIKAQIVSLDTIGFLLPTARQQGIERMTRGAADFDQITLSGAEPKDQPITRALGGCVVHEPGKVVGRSLAMGGMVTGLLASSLAPGQQGLHLGMSPEGPFYRIAMQGGGPV